MAPGKKLVELSLYCSILWYCFPEGVQVEQSIEQVGGVFDYLGGSAKTA